MRRITSTEFRKHYGKYASLAERETIDVTKRGKTALSLALGNQSKVGLALSICGITPEEARVGEEPFERG